MQQYDDETLNRYRQTMGMITRMQGGANVIPFPAAWMTPRSKRVVRPEVDLLETRPATHYDFGGYVFCPVRLVKWALAVMRPGQSITGLYPKSIGVEAGRFLIKRSRDNVIGYCEIGTHHYVFRPQSIHRYNLPYHYQRPLAPLSMDAFLAMYPDNNIWLVDSTATEVYLYGNTSDVSRPDWHLAELDSSRRHPTLILQEGQVMPVDPNILQQMVVKDIAGVGQLLSIMVCPHNLFSSRRSPTHKLLEPFDRKRPTGESYPLSYEQAWNIVTKVQELCTILEVENDRITSGAEDVVPWLESTLKEAALYIKQQFGSNYSRELKK